MNIDYGRIYRKWHSDTPEHVATMRAYYQRILGPHLPADRRAPILDVGCGMGFASIAVKALGFSAVLGVDSDSSQVASCKAKGLDVVQTEDTLAWLRERPGAFGAILALDLIEHIPVDAQLEFVRAVAGALTATGRLICTVPNANSILASRYRYICWTHRCSFTEHSLDFLLYNGGFGTIDVREVDVIQRPPRWWWPGSGGRHWWAFRFFRLWRRLQMMAELGPSQGRSVPLSLNLLCVADKAPAQHAVGG
jgi:SAM-dependent methyltransferase